MDLARSAYLLLRVLPAALTCRPCRRSRSPAFLSWRYSGAKSLPLLGVEFCLRSTVGASRLISLFIRCRLTCKPEVR